MCATTLFNLHVFCENCAYSLCSECYNEPRLLELAEQECTSAIGNDDNLSKNHSYKWAKILDNKTLANLKEFDNRFSATRNEINISKEPSTINVNDSQFRWLQNQQLLFLTYAQSENNVALFQSQWKQHKPIIVTGIDRKYKGKPLAS